ncbi:hypothetical protein ABZ714_21280 [Streptomyces sp. NPDC006798]|uniref:DUF7848 domain-containing protein n=1 Tax=Streptomyces sp. NPDC006798 TaxID=3155462 RepID=UPI0034023580
MKRHFRHIDWTLKEVPSADVRVHVVCVSGIPQCTEELPRSPDPVTREDADAWKLSHFTATGHRRFEELSSRVVQWDPDDDVDPRTILGVTT